MLVVAQPDLGSGLVYLAVLGAILFIAGTPWTHFAALGGLAAIAIVVVLVAAPAVGVEVLKPYQKDRLTAFLNPGENQGKEAYQINQSLTAIGSGGKTGRGDQATQTKLDFLPEHHTDFVFSVVGRGVRVRGRRARAFAVRAAYLARTAYSYDGEELLRRACRRRHHRDADVPSLRKRGHDDFESCPSPASPCRS